MFSKELLNQGLPIVSKEALADPGAPVFSASPRGVKAKRRSPRSVRIPRLASVRISR
jgi:hypothetical protein